METFKLDHKGLLEAIQRMMKLMHLVRMSSVNKLRRLGHIYIFLENIIETCIIKIKLSHGLVIRDGKS